MAHAKGGGSLPDPTVLPRVIDAVLDELASSGRARLSMDRIAQRAGVSKATMYTRWDSKDDLLVAAYQRLSRPFPTLDTGTLAGDLDALCEVVVAGATDPTLQPHLLAVSDTWQAGIRAMLHAAQDRRELDADVAVPLLAEVVSALTIRRVMFKNPPIDHTLRTDLDELIRHPPHQH